MRRLYGTIALETLVVMLAAAMGCQTVEEVGQPPDGQAGARDECGVPSEAPALPTSVLTGTAAATAPKATNGSSGVPGPDSGPAATLLQSQTPSGAVPSGSPEAITSPEAELVEVEETPVCVPVAELTPFPLVVQPTSTEFAVTTPLPSIPNLASPRPSTPPCTPADTGSMPSATVPPLDVEFRPTGIGLLRWAVESGVCLQVEGVEIRPREESEVRVLLTFANNSTLSLSFAAGEIHVSDAAGGLHAARLVPAPVQAGGESDYLLSFPIDASQVRDLVWRHEGFAEVRIPLLP